MYYPEPETQQEDNFNLVHHEQKIDFDEQKIDLSAEIDHTIKENDESATNIDVNDGIASQNYNEQSVDIIAEIEPKAEKNDNSVTNTNENEVSPAFIIYRLCLFTPLLSFSSLLASSASSPLKSFS